jgi:hypothetical protein
MYDTIVLCLSSRCTTEFHTYLVVQSRLLDVNISVWLRRYTTLVQLCCNCWWSPLRLYYSTLLHRLAQCSVLLEHHQLSRGTVFTSANRTLMWYCWVQLLIGIICCTDVYILIMSIKCTQMVYWYLHKVYQLQVRCSRSTLTTLPSTTCVVMGRLRQLKYNDYMRCWRQRVELRRLTIVVELLM